MQPKLKQGQEMSFTRIDDGGKRERRVSEIGSSEQILSFCDIPD
jgi:hypothetical protein